MASFFFSEDYKKEEIDITGCLGCVGCRKLVGRQAQSAFFPEQGQDDVGWGSCGTGDVGAKSIFSFLGQVLFLDAQFGAKRNMSLTKY